jgi:hypothetical protein
MNPIQDKVRQALRDHPDGYFRISHASRVSHSVLKAFARGRDLNADNLTKLATALGFELTRKGAPRV